MKKELVWTKFKQISAILMLIFIIPSVNAASTLQGITAYYPFEGTANDGVGTYHGTVYGATQTKGINGYAYSFDGINDYLSLPRSVSDDFTIVFWVYTTQTANADPRQWYIGNGLVDAEIDYERDDFGTALLGGKASFGIGNETLRKDVTIESTSTINDGRWHQVAAVRSKTAGEMKLYVDGVLEAKGAGTKNSLNDSPFIGVGNNPCDISYNRRWFNGKIDEIQIYSRVLNGDDIQNLYQSVKNSVLTDQSDGLTPSISAENIVGVWQRTDGADIYTVYPDGRITTALNGQTYTGRWQKKDANFIFDWDIRPSGRKYIDTVTLSPDGSSFSGTNNEGYNLNAKKIGMPLSESITPPGSAPANPTVTTSSANAKSSQSQGSTNVFLWLIPFLVVVLLAGGAYIFYKKRSNPIQPSPDILSDQKTGSNPLYQYLGILLLFISGLLIFLQIITMGGSSGGGIQGTREFTVDLIIKLMIGGAGWYLYTKAQPKKASQISGGLPENKYHVGKGPDSEVLQLKNQLLNPGWETFEQSANQIGSYSRSAPDKIIPLIPMLIKDLYSSEDRVASGAALALTKIGERNSEILVPSIHDFIQFLEYTKNHTYEIIGKRAVIFILGIVGVKNPALVIPVVSEYLNDRDEYVQKNARQAIKNLNSPAIKISIPPKMNYSEINYSDVDPEVLEQNKRNWEREEKSRLDAEIRKKEEKQKEKAESGVYTSQNDIKIGNNEERVSISFTDKDNLGTRQDNIHQANAYWLARNISQKFTPFILYTFEKESDARDALLELDCIHVAKDTGNLICTEPLYFGYYLRDDGKYSAVVIGESLTHELWVAAKDSFAKHRGQRKNDQEPETRESNNPETKMVKPNQVTFVQEKRQQGQMGETLIYRIYKAPDAVSAKAFLQQNPVNENFKYIVVETPDGNYGRDIEGMYKE